MSVRFALVGLVVLGLSGCSFFQRPSSSTGYLLTVKRPSVDQSDRGRALVVRFFGVNPTFGGQEFIYRLTDEEWESDYYHNFSVSPAEMITSLTRRWLRDSPAFSRVSAPGESPLAAPMLTGTIERLYGDFRDLKSPQAVIAIRYELWRSEVHNQRRPVFSKRYIRKVPFLNRTPEALVSGWSEAMKGILEELERDLRIANAR